MRTLLALCLAFPLLLAAEEKAHLTALTSLDDARLSAMKSADAAKLGGILSDELRYAHSSGVVDTKASFIDSLTSGKLKYLGVDYVERNFTFPAPGIAMMTGSAKFKLNSANGEITPTLAFLAIWRLEGDQWRFLAWQSCKLP